MVELQRAIGDPSTLHSIHERNRESARVSRRRKKETLLFLGKKVHKLQDSLDKLRSSRVLEMESQLSYTKVESFIIEQQSTLFGKV